MEANVELDAQIQEMRKYFFVPLPTEDFFSKFDVDVALLQAEYQVILKAFRYNLASALSTVSMPFALASASVEQSNFQRIHTAELIRARSIDEDTLQPGEDLEAAREREASTKSDVRMREFVESEGGRNTLILDTCEFLLASLKYGLETATQELLQQGLVLLWSAFEILCRDIFETLLNNDPMKVQSLTNHPTTRKRFEVDKMSFDTLVQYGFDLSARLGTVLVSQQDFSDLPTIKAVYGVLFPSDADLHHTLAHRDLWTLYQRRHLMVHRRGVIDRVYLNATGETLAIGIRLSVSPADFEDALKVVLAAGIALMRSLK